MKDSTVKNVMALVGIGVTSIFQAFMSIMIVDSVNQVYGQGWAAPLALALGVALASTITWLLDGCFPKT